MAPHTASPRPSLATDESANAAARDAVDAFVAELQGALNRADADAYDAPMAHDVVWGTPFGAIVEGVDELNAIHRRLMANPVTGPSRYEVRSVFAPAPDVALAHVARVALDGGFSEMALYVLVRRDGRWLLAAGQNTPVDPDKGALRR